MRVFMDDCGRFVGHSIARVGNEAERSIAGCGIGCIEFFPQVRPVEGAEQALRHLGEATQAARRESRRGSFSWLSVT